MKTAKRYIIRTKSGEYVERFYGVSVAVTSNINAARKYTKSAAEKMLAKWDLKYDIIEL